MSFNYKKFEKAAALTIIFGGAALVWNLDKILLNDRYSVPETDEQTRARLTEQVLEKEYRAQWPGWNRIHTDIQTAAQSPEASTDGIYTLDHKISFDFSRVNKQVTEDMAAMKKMQETAPQKIAYMCHGMGIFLGVIGVMLVGILPSSKKPQQNPQPAIS